MWNGSMQEISDGASSRIIAPELPIIDPHHHLWIQPHGRYLIDEFRADLATGHNVLATVYVECSAMYRKSGPEALRTVGEAEFVAGMAAMSESGHFGPTRICAGFVGAAAIIVYRHRENIDRIHAGEERIFSFRRTGS